MKHTNRVRVAPGVWQLKKNRLYEIRVRVKHPRTGKDVGRWGRFDGTQTAALAAREQWRLELHTALVHPRRPETVASYAASWMSMKLRRGDLAPSTARKYAEAIDLHVIPTFGDVGLEHLVTRDIKEWLASKAERFAASSCNSWLRTFATMLNDAMTDGLITHNPAGAVRAVRELDDVDEDNSLHVDELRAYLDAWQEMHPEFYPLILVLALTGARWGEATALKWSDIDEAERTGLLLIRRSHWCGKLKLPKTDKRRYVPYPAVLSDAMKAHRQQAIAKQHPSLEGGWCFTATNGKLLRHGRLSTESKAVLKQAGIDRRVTIHGLRRTMTDLLRLSAVDQVTAAALIGHDTDRMRRHYSTVRPDEARAAGERVAQLVAAPRGDGRSDGRTGEDGKEKTS